MSSIIYHCSVNYTVSLETKVKISIKLTTVTNSDGCVVFMSMYFHSVVKNDNFLDLNYLLNWESGTIQMWSTFFCLCPYTLYRFFFWNEVSWNKQQGPDFNSLLAVNNATNKGRTQVCSPGPCSWKAWKTSITLRYYAGRAFWDYLVLGTTKIGSGSGS